MSVSDVTQSTAPQEAPQTPPPAAEQPGATTTPPNAAEAVSEPEKGAHGEIADPAGYIASLRQESARHRIRARDAEAARDRLAVRVDAMDRAAVEAAGMRVLLDPSDVWLAGVELDRLRRDGELDLELVSAEIERIARERPHWKVPAPNFAGGARAPHPAETAPSFGQRLKQIVTGEQPLDY